MTGYSLRIRLVLGGLIAILIALGIAGGSLVLLFERHVSRTLASDLDIHLKQLLAGIEIDPTGSVVLTQSPSDPRFSEPLSGIYWQLRDDRGQFLRSRSLWDASLDLPPDNPGPSEVHQHEVAGPSNTRLLVAERAVTLAVGDGRVAVRVAVAANLARVSEAARAFAKDLALALGTPCARLGNRNIDSGCARAEAARHIATRHYRNSSGSQPSPSGKRARRSASACGGGQCPHGCASPGDRTVA